jgi:hypothetical protein
MDHSPGDGESLDGYGQLSLSHTLLVLQPFCSDNFENLIEQTTRPKYCTLYQNCIHCIKVVNCLGRSRSLLGTPLSLKAELRRAYSNTMYPHCVQHELAPHSAATRRIFSRGPSQRQEPGAFSFGRGGFKTLFHRFGDCRDH